MHVRTQTSFPLLPLRESQSRVTVWGVQGIAGFLVPQTNWSSFKVKGSALLGDYSIFKKHTPSFTCFSDSRDEGSSGEKQQDPPLSHYTQNRCGVSSLFQNPHVPQTFLGCLWGARHSVTHWSSNSEHNRVGPCPQRVCSPEGEIRCYKECCNGYILVWQVYMKEPKAGGESRRLLGEQTSKLTPEGCKVMRNVTL